MVATSSRASMVSPLLVVMSHCGTCCSVVARWLVHVLHVVAAQSRLRHPDFVVGRKVGRHFQIRDKLFDYQGRYRKAAEAAEMPH